MNICFFCASSETLNEKYYTSAKQFGEIIAKNNWTLVTGGANVGLMKTLTKTAIANNGKTIGIIPRDFDNKKLSCYDNTEIIITEGMQERKQIIFEKSDAFVILPGGFGTLDEFFEIVTLKQIGQIDKPIVIFNQEGFYSHLLKQMDILFEENFANQQNKDSYFVSQSIEETINYMKA